MAIAQVVLTALLILLSGSAASAAPIVDHPGMPRHRGQVPWSDVGVDDPQLRVDMLLPEVTDDGSVADVPGNAADGSDLPDVALLEVGDVVGLDHVPDGDDIAIPRALGTNRRTLSGDDIPGVRDLSAIPKLSSPSSLPLIAIGVFTTFLGSGLRYLVSRRRGRRSPRSTKPA